MIYNLKIKIFLFLFLSLAIGTTAIAQEKKTEHTNNKWQEEIQKFYLKGYGIVNYYNYDWETNPNQRDVIDAERLNLYLGYHFSDKIELKTEIEFEHGGTGSTMEFDVFEEFGEFEQEIEAGGEVILEQINLLFKIHPAFNIRAGKFRLYLGNAATLDDPTEYFTGQRSEVENTILPLGWYEHGIEISGDFGVKSATNKWQYKFYLINGLDPTGFSSRSWIRPGYQKRFETVNANNLAVAGRLDYVFAKDSYVGLSSYFGNTTNNRPKPDLDVDAYVTTTDVHLVWEGQPWRVRAYGMYGTLSNSEAVSYANRNLSNNLNVKRTAVGASAVGAYVEAAYDLLALSNKKKSSQLYLFGRAEYFDSMFSTKGEIFDNPRWERTIYTGGINYYPHKKIVLKGHYSFKEFGSGEQDHTVVLGMGFKL